MIKDRLQNYLGAKLRIALFDLLFSKYPVRLFVKNTHLREFGNNLD